MQVVNAISKVRFSAGKPQHVPVLKGPPASAGLVCLEAGQEMRSDHGPRVYYVVTGKASLTAGGQSHQLAPGQLAHTDEGEEHVLANQTEGRLVCLVVSSAE